MNLWLPIVLSLVKFIIQQLEEHADERALEVKEKFAAIHDELKSIDVA